MTILLAILLAVTTIAWVIRERILRGLIDTAFTAGRKLGRASAFLSQGQIDNMLIDAGIDPAKLPR